MNAIKAWYGSQHQHEPSFEFHSPLPFQKIIWEKGRQNCSSFGPPPTSAQQPLVGAERGTWKPSLGSHVGGRNTVTSATTKASMKKLKLGIELEIRILEIQAFQLLDKMSAPRFYGLSEPPSCIQPRGWMDCFLPPSPWTPVQAYLRLRDRPSFQ